MHWLRTLRDFTGHYFCTVATVIICSVLVVGVPQIWYAFDPTGFRTTFHISLIPIGLFLTYFLISSIGILSGGFAFRRKSFRRRSEGAELKPFFAAFLWIVAWPNWLARRLNKWQRILAAILMLSVGIGLAAVNSLGLGRHYFAYPLSDLLWVNVAWILATPAMWLIICNPAKWSEPGETPNVRQVMGWRIGWLCSTALIGEAVWFIASLQLAPSFGYLMYTQWAVLQFLFFAVLTAHTLDYLDRELSFPIRLFGVTAFFVIQIFNLRPERVLTKEIVVPQGSTRDASSENESPPWITRFERRVDAVPVGPCIIVAASGGGTRAALFASLVLRGAEKETSFADHKFSEHVVLTSSVSGGSLGVAEALIGRAKKTGKASSLRSSDRRELVEFIREALEGELENLDSDNVRSRVTTEELALQLESRLNAVKNRLAELQGLTSGASQDAWVLSDPVLDGVTTDFMAPILRGAVTPLVSRGEALRRFWDQTFQWTEITNVNDRFQQEDGTVAPVILFNACNTAWGTRFTIGFPALPQPFFASDLSNSTVRTRYPVRSLSDTNPLHEILLSDAVRVSSNFPWGFRVRTLAETNLLDGGMVDNTGIDTIYEVFRRLNELEHGRRVLAKMARKGVFLLEIDSSGKPRGKRQMTSRAGGLLEPLATFGNALHTNADIVKQHYVSSIELMFRQVLQAELNEQIAKIPDSTGISQADYSRLNVVAHVPFQCENFGGSPLSPKDYRTVMTAWALDTKQKGQVVARFLVELTMFRAAIESHRELLLQDLGQLAVFDRLVSNDRLRQKTSELERLTAEQKGSPEVSEELLDKIAELGLEQSVAAVQNYELPQPVKRVLDKGWIRRLDPSNLDTRQTIVIQQPTPGQLEELERDAQQAENELNAQQTRLQNEFVETLRRPRRKSSFAEIQRQFQAKQSLSEQILD